MTSFDDGLGYYAGLYFGSPCAVRVRLLRQQLRQRRDSGSRQLHPPGHDVRRVADSRSFYGSTVTIDGVPHILGTGNPKDSDVAWGVKMQLVSKAADNSTAVLSFLFDPEQMTPTPTPHRDRPTACPRATPPDRPTPSAGPPTPTPPSVYLAGGYQVEASRDPSSGERAGAQSRR